MRELHSTTVAKLKGFFIRAYYSYISAVTEGKRIAGKYEHALVDRQLDDMRKCESGDPAWEWVFDWDKAVRPLVWMAANLKFPDGIVMGKSIKFEPWQIFIVMCLFGWQGRRSHTRRFLNLYMEVPRKNGKSTLGGALIDYMAFADEEWHGEPCYVAATTLTQAEETFRRAADCLELGKHDGVLIADSKNNKVIRYGKRRVVAIDGKPKDGKLGHAALIDEYHQHVSNDLRDSIMSGNVSDPETLTMMITTAGKDLNCVCKQEHDKCIQILDGILADDRYLIAIYAPDDGDEPQSEITWEKANPNWGISVDADTFRARYGFIKNSPDDLIDFKTKNLNMWCNAGVNRWADMDLWVEYCCEPFDPDGLRGRWCTGGLDLASNSDFAAFVLDFPHDDPKHYRDYLVHQGVPEQIAEAKSHETTSSIRHRQLYHCWVPEDRVDALSKQLRIPLRQWIQDGHITATPGATIDYDYIAQYIESCRLRYDLRYIACDKWKIDSLRRLMPEWFDDIALIFSQGMMSMSPSLSEYERLYKIGDIESGGNPVMRWMMSCADVKEDTSGNKKLVKPKVSRSKARIDLVIASIMANDTAITQYGSGLTLSNLANAIQL